MPFDFPPTPNIGDVANGFIYDGIGWAGGPSPAQAMPTEQFFNIPAGTVNLDIPVPSWATAVQIIGAVYTPNAANNVLMRVSADGTNFFAGASDYNVSGPVHNTGSSGYGNVAGAASSYLYIGASADQGQAVPHNFTAEMNLTRPSTSTAFSQKAYAKMYDSNAATLQRTFWHQGWLASNVTTALALKAIRIYASPGPMSAGSWVRVKWLGDTGLAQVPAPGTVLLGKVWGTLTGTVAIPTSSSIETAYANITVKSASSRLYVSGGCFIGAATGTLEHYTLILQAPTGTQIQSNGGTNNPTSGIYVSLMATGSYAHGQPVGTTIRCASRVARGAGTNAATVNSGWLFVEEVNA